MEIFLHHYYSLLPCNYVPILFHLQFTSGVSLRVGRKRTEEQEGKLLEKLTLYLGLHSVATRVPVKAGRAAKLLQNPLAGSDTALK